MKKEDILPKSLPESIRTLASLVTLILALAAIGGTLSKWTSEPVLISMRLLLLTAAGILLLLAFLSWQPRRRDKQIANLIQDVERVKTEHAQATSKLNAQSTEEIKQLGNQIAELQKSHEKRARFGVYWDLRLEAYCPACGTLLSGYGNYQVTRDTRLWCWMCVKCNSKIVPTDDRGDNIQLNDAQIFIRTKMMRLTNGGKTEWV